MKIKTLSITLAIIFLISISLLSLTSAVVVDVAYITLLPGESGRITIEIDNNENFDIEDVTIELDLSGRITISSLGVITEQIDALPFTIIGSSERDIDELDEDDDDTVSFILRASTDIKPGDYNIPYILKYTDADDNEDIVKTGSFGIRVSAETELDFSVETRETAIVDEEGKISLEIINEVLGNIKSVSVRIFPQGFELLSKDKIFIGTVDADDTDIATFDVIYRSTRPILIAKITFKDFENNEQTRTVKLPFKVYTEEEAIDRGLIEKSNTRRIIIVIVIVLVAWFVYRKIKKSRKTKKKGKN